MIDLGSQQHAGRQLTGQDRAATIVISSDAVASAASVAINTENLRGERRPGPPPAPQRDR